jgi:hypothetical protein
MRVREEEGRRLTKDAEITDDEGDMTCFGVDMPRRVEHLNALLAESIAVSRDMARSPSRSARVQDRTVYNDGLPIDNDKSRGSDAGVVVKGFVMSEEDAGARRALCVFKKCWWRG